MVKEEKLKAVEELKNKIDSSEAVALLDMSRLPSRQFQEIKKQLREDVGIIMVKKSILLNALKNSKKENILGLEKIIPAQPALALTNLEPFKFYMRADRLKSPNYAKEGDITGDGITVMAGPTGLMPGPAISEFSKLGIPAGVEEGKIAVKRDKVVAKKGDIISKDLASILRKLNIQPIKVGLNIVAVYYRGKIYKKDVLSLAGEGYLNKLQEAHNQALNLSVAIVYPTKENIKLLLVKAYRHAKAVAGKTKTEADKNV